MLCPLIATAPQLVALLIPSSPALCIYLSIYLSANLHPSPYLTRWLPPPHEHYGRFSYGDVDSSPPPSSSSEESTSEFEADFIWTDSAELDPFTLYPSALSHQEHAPVFPLDTTGRRTCGNLSLPPQHTIWGPDHNGPEGVRSGFMTLWSWPPNEDPLPTCFLAAPAMGATDPD